MNTLKGTSGLWVAVLLGVGGCTPILGLDKDYTLGGGDGGGGVTSAGNPGADFVAAGNHSTDSTHRLVSSLGQAPGVNGVSRSSKYQFVGGLVASTQP